MAAGGASSIHQKAPKTHMTKMKHVAFKEASVTAPSTTRMQAGEQAVLLFPNRPP